MTDDSADIQPIHLRAFEARLKPESSLAAEAAKEKTVRMRFPRNIGVVMDDHSIFKFERQNGDEPGLPFECEVPGSLADHPYLKRAGVERIEQQKPKK